MESDTSEEGSLLARPYQTELEEIAIKKNTLIYLPTGSGKTFIAVRLIQRFRKSLNGVWGQGAKRTFFLVNTVPLVKQQHRIISKLCPVKGVNGYSGEDRIDFWKKAKWDDELNKYQVIVMTSQILCDMLTHQYIYIRDINLLIFDECHHAIDDHPMRMVMKHFETCPVEDHPRVVGLTATLLNANVTLQKVEETLRKLETTFHATIATVNELGEVLTYSTNPHELVVPFKATEEISTTGSAREEALCLLKDLERLVIQVKLPVAKNDAVELNRKQTDITTDPMKVVKRVRNMITSMAAYIKELGIYGGNISILAYIVLLEQLKRRSTLQEEQLLFKVTITFLIEVRMVLMKAMRFEKGYEKIVTHSSAKVLKLLEILKEYNPNVIKSDAKLNINLARNELCGIIFVKQRFTAKVLFNLLKDVGETNPEEFGFLKQDFVVGFNINPYNNTREDYFTKKKSQQILLKFCNKDLNCVISTSIIEEGIDVPQCLLVVRFDPPMEYRSYVQSKGRARSPQSSFVILIPDTEYNKFMGKYQEYKKIEQYIQKSLSGKTDTRDSPTGQAIRRELYEDEDIPPYITENGNRLSAVSAISLLNRYCSCLPHDLYTLITPMWIKEEKNCKTVVAILLPISSSIKEPIRGIPTLDLKTAKRSAALNACIRLHRIGELDATTLLPKVYGKVNYGLVDVRECFPNWPWDTDEDEGDSTAPQSGTKKKVRKHPRAYPFSLEDSMAEKDCKQTFRLHVIDFKAAFEEPKDRREKALYDLLQSKNGYGFLTVHNLPQLCDFPMFLSVGEVSISLKLNYAVITLDHELFDVIKQFHFFVFDQLLEVAKKFLVYDGTRNNLFVVPIKFDNGYDIDWEIIQEYRVIPPVVPPPLETRKSIHVTDDGYMHKVVTPWYRGTIFPDRYIVSKVLEHMTPKSCFEHDTTSFDTYLDYYSSKYNLEIEGSKGQPLLEVRNFGTRINCLMPRSATIHTFTEKQKKLVSVAQGDDKPKGFAEIFIPEFCIKYDFPGMLWYKATMLPSIIHRIFMLLIAEELRLEITLATKYGEAVLKEGDCKTLLEAEEDCLYPLYAKRRKLLTKYTVLSASKSAPPLDLVPCSTTRSAKNFEIKILYFDIQEPKIDCGTRWLPLEADMQVAMKSLLSQVEGSEVESALRNTIDRINNPIDLAARKPLKIISMKDSVYQLQKQKLDKEYPWEESMEPIDIERNLATVTVMDIECFDEFINTPVSSKVGGNSMHAKTKSFPITSAAILPPPIEYNDKIELLDKRPVGRGPELRDILSSLTTIKSNDTFNLERTETLGDAFLKYAASLYLFHKFPMLNEGQLTNIKCRLIGNRNLYYAGEKVNLSGRMKIEPFSPKCDFVVPAFSAPKSVKEFIEKTQIRPSFLLGMQFSLQEALSGKLTEASLNEIQKRYTEFDGAAEKEPKWAVQNSMQCYVQAQAVPDKTVADCVESLIGTYLTYGGILGGVKILEWLKIIPEKDGLATLLNKKVDTVYTQKKATPLEIDFLMNYVRPDIEEILGYKFNDPSLLLEALSHASYIRNRFTPSYERLEFIGDAILDFLITAHIYENCKDFSPGDITDLRSALVNNVTFASYVVKLGLHKYICSQLNPVLDDAILAFVEHQEQRDHEIVEDVLYLIEEEECQIAQYVEVPKALSDLFESLVGAIYLDSGGSLETVWKIVYKIMYKEIYNFSKRIPIQPVRVISEMIYVCPHFGDPKVTTSEIPKVMVPITFTKEGRQHTVYGVGSNKFQAKRAAAKLALKVLGY